MKTKLAVFFGGRSVEHDVSIVTGLQAIEHVNLEKYAVIPVYLARNGAWYIGEKLLDVSIFQEFEKHEAEVTQVRLSTVPGEGLLTDKGALAVDVALLCMHGLHGEDGTLQGLLELADIPYTSPSVGGSAAGMDKALMKKVFAGCGFPMMPSIDVTRHAYQMADEQWLAKMEALGYPLYVKPANLGSSIGISRVENRDALKDAIDLAFAYDRKVVVEKGVADAMEINCSVLGIADDCRASLCEKPLGWKDFLTFEDKYLRGGKGKNAATRQIPAPIEETMTDRIQTLAKQIFTEMDCKGVVRIDFLVDNQTGELYVNEINTIPGSMAFYLWEPCGLSYEALIDELVGIAKCAAEEKKKNSYAYDSAILQKVRSGGAKGIKGSKGTK